MTPSTVGSEEGAWGVVAEVEISNGRFTSDETPKLGERHEVTVQGKVIYTGSGRT